MGLTDAERYRLDPCPVCPPYWVATKTYTARCPVGQVGDSVTETRQARSTIGQSHAEKEALRLAREAAEAQLVCSYRATACLVTPCLVVIGTVTSNFDDHFTIEFTQDPPLIPRVGDVLTLVAPDDSLNENYTVLEVFGAENEQVRVDPTPFFTIPPGTEVIHRPLVCCEKASTASQADADARALACAQAQAANLCQYGDLLPIGSIFL